MTKQVFENVRSFTLKDSLSWVRRWKSLFSLLLCLLLLASCENHMVIVSDVDEREANEIIVFLASKGIVASKTPSVSSAPGAAQGPQKWSIAVSEGKATDAMAILNQTIRYQAGLAEQIANTIRKIDGVIDADVQISFPSSEGTAVLPGAQAVQQKITAAVYVKHQGVLDDPNSHLVMKIKRLVAGSVNGLDVNDVTVISDRARFADITLAPTPEDLSPKAKEYVSIWSIVMSKNSASRFRVLFFFLSFLAIVFGIFTAWLIWKLYPMIKNRGGLKQLIHPVPFGSEGEETQTAQEQASQDKK
jgi:type III secretion protein J